MCANMAVLKVKTEKGGASHQWCRRRGLEQQRFYEMTKLRDQFQEILQVGRGGEEGGEGQGARHWCWGGKGRRHGI